MFKSFKIMWRESDYISFFGFIALIVLNTAGVAVFVFSLLFQ